MQREEFIAHSPLVIEELISFVPEALPRLSPVQVYVIGIYDVKFEILSIGPRLKAIM